MCKICRILFYAPCHWVWLFLAVGAPNNLTAAPLIITNMVVEAAFRNSEYTVRAWTRLEGLPQNWINAITQTQDGYLWIGSQNGLARFDGARFVVFDPDNTPALKSSRISFLHVDSQQRLWVTSEFGDIAYLQDGVFKGFNASDGVPEYGFRAVHEDRAGTIWLSSRYRIAFFRFENGRFLPSQNPPGIQLGGAYNMALENDGTLWAYQTISDPEQTLIRILPGPHRPWEVRHGRRSLGIHGLTGSRAGGVWVLTDLGLHHYVRGDCDRLHRVPREETEALTKTSNGRGMIEDRNGLVWVPTHDAGLFQFDQKGTVRHFSFGETEELLRVNALFEDREGNIWIGLAGGGLRLLKPRVFSAYTREDGLGSDVIKSVCEDATGAILASHTRQIDRIHEGRIAPLVDRTLLTSAPNAITTGADGSLWVSSNSDGLFHFVDGKKQAFLAPYENRFFGPRAWNIFRKSDGTIYLGSRDNLYKTNGNILKETGPLAGLKEYDIRSIAEDSRGNFYLGLNADGLLVQAGTNWSQLTQASGLPGNNVWALFMDRADTLWGGAVSAGLFRYLRGSVFSFAKSIPTLPRVVNSIIEDEAGYLWLASNEGIFRVDKKKLNDLADGRGTPPHVMKYGVADGLETTESAAGYQPMVCKAGDGRLWFAMTKGVAVVNPKKLPSNPVRPPVLIEEVRIDEQQLLVPKEGGFEVPPGNRRVEIQYTAPSFAAPEDVRFKYKLEDFDNAWTEAGSRRTAYFQGLRPGRYRFRVIACNSDGVWNQSGAALAFVVRPFFWQTNLFRAVLIAAAGVMLILAYLQRISIVEKRQRAQEELSRRLIESQELERKRIAAELHDSLGQKLQLIRNHAQLARDTARTSTSIAAIAGITGDAITEVRAITAALRPSELDEIGLQGAIEWMIESVGKASGLKILAEIDPIDRILSPANEMNLYRIVQEALNNIIKHAKATEVTVEIKKNEGELAISIFDNGAGFDLEKLPARTGPGRLGLAGIGERVRILGGTHVIDSKVGMGTRLTINIPLAV